MRKHSAFVRSCPDCSFFPVGIKNTNYRLIIWVPLHSHCACWPLLDINSSLLKILRLLLFSVWWLLHYSHFTKIVLYLTSCSKSWWCPSYCLACQSVVVSTILILKIFQILINKLLMGLHIGIAVWSQISTFVSSWIFTTILISR